MVLVDSYSYLPIQLTPFPVYPWLQVQVKLPGVLVQLALVSQLSVLSVHSLILSHGRDLYNYSIIKY